MAREGKLFWLEENYLTKKLEIGKDQGCWELNIATNYGLSVKVHESGIN